ncbi:MAG: hypothetical protein FJ267_17700 [Planctomycetes bacterium]|nr:hypothetical protein [Planctomycetota bacterium]
MKRREVFGVVLVAAALIVASACGTYEATTEDEATEEVTDDTELATEDEATEDTVGTGLGSKDASGDIDSLDCGSPDVIGVSYPSVKITNRSEKRSNYFVTVSYESADGSTKYDEAIIMVLSLNPGQSMTEEGLIMNEIPDGAICKVTEVQRTSDE